MRPQDFVTDTGERAMEQLGVSAPTATKTIRLLEESGMLKQRSGSRWGRVWVAPPILKAVEADGPIKRSGER